MADNDPDMVAIPVPHPSMQIILTPPRHSDGPAVLATLNDARVYMNLNGPPYPYTEKDWEEWFPIISYAASTNLEELKVVKELQQAAGDADPICGKAGMPCIGKLMWASTIREVVRSDSGEEEERFIGAITVERSNFLHILNEEERKKRKEENHSLGQGEPSISWETGFYLTPDCHGRGIMPAVLRTLMNEILVPYMNVHVLTGTHFEHNLPSRKVFEKCGFQSTMSVPDAVTLPATKTGGRENIKVGLGVLTWERDTSV